MISLSIAWFFTLFLMIGLLLVFFLWLYYDRRDRRLYEDQRLRKTFHCIRCDTLYAAPSQQQEQPCPRCGFRNASLRF